MKTAIRKQMTIRPEVMDLLNDQIGMEMRASASYLAKASWCDQRSLVNSAHFFYKQAEEEREHAMKIFKFINDNGGAALSPEISDINHNFEDLRTVFVSSLDQEIAVTDAIFNLFKAARNANDFVSEQFLQWFIEEQAEEEDSFRGIIDLIDLMEDSPLKMIDERIPKE